MTHHRRQFITDLNTHLTKISHPYQCRKSHLSYGIWNKSLNMIEIIHQHRSASKSFLFMGITKNSKLYLYPEEAIFLMQCSLLQIVRNEKDKIPIALDEVYSMSFNQTLLSLEHLHVYQYLTRFGFILLRHRLEIISNEKSEELAMTTISIGMKRKLSESEMELTGRSTESMEEEQDYICSIHSSSECQRPWFPRYTDEPPFDIKQYPPVAFPDQFSPVHIDWIPADFNQKVANVKLSIYENKICTPRPSYSLIRPIDLQSHSTIYQRLVSFAPRSNTSLPPPSSSSSVFFDMYTPRKHFRKTQPGLPDYYLQIKNGNDEFCFDEIYNEQQKDKLTAVVHHGDISFYTFKSFDPLAALQS